MAISDFVSGGYIITKYLESASYNHWMRTVLDATEVLLPDKVLSVGLCGAPYAPVLSWASSIEEDYTQFGIMDQDPELKQWADKQYNIAIGYPNIFFYLPTAIEYVKRFAHAPDIQILGMGVHMQDLPLIAEAEELRPASINDNGTITNGFSDTGFARSLRLAQPCAPGEILGFDVICCHYNIDHSWHCNGLAVTAFREFHFLPNQFGLIDDKANADKLVHWINENETKAEPGIWLPVLISRYSLMT